MSVGSNRLFFRFPWLFFVLAIFLIVNNIFTWFPESVLNGPVKFIVPGVLIFFGAAGYFWKWREAKADRE